MAYRDFENLTKRTASDKILHDEAFNNAKNPKYDGYQRDIAPMVFWQKDFWRNSWKYEKWKMKISQTCN